MRYADSVVVGEGTSIWPQLLADFRLGLLHKRYKGSYRNPAYKDLPVPRRDILPKGSFLTRASVIATRGCHNRCNFCLLSTRGVSVPRQAIPVDQVIQQIVDLGDAYVVFLDNNLSSDQDYLVELCRRLEPLGIIWSAAVSLDVTDNPVLVRQMAWSGCTGVFVGFESLNPANLALESKSSPPPDEFGWRARVFQDSGIQVNGSFVLGFDHDRSDVFERTTDWIDTHKLECATFQILTPYPATPLFRRLEEEERILHHRWDLYDTAHAVFEPRHMDPEQLEKGYAGCYESVFSLASIWARRPDRTSAALSYLASTLIYKKMNWLWAWLIRHRLVSTVWRPLVGAARRRHLAERCRRGAPSFLNNTSFCQLSLGGSDD
jgi:radical SAM superfamily enzyme YgiQ (UPF0313 family)